MSTMSIYEACSLVETLEREKRLVRFTPRLVGNEACLRRISLSPKISTWVQNATKNPDLKAAVRAHFKTFVVGDTVDDRDFMKRVERRSADGSSFNDCVWSVRPFFSPKHRFFGAFAAPDWLLIFNMQSRTYLGSDDERWNREVFKTCRIWNALLPDYPKPSYPRFGGYVTFKSEHRDVRWNEN